MKTIIALILVCLVASNANAWHKSDPSDYPTPYPSPSKKNKSQSKKSEPSEDERDTSPAFKEQVAKWKDQNGVLQLNLVKDAATTGNVAAQFFLGVCYQDGLFGCEKDPNAAVDSLKKAAEQGNVDSQFMLGGLYSLNDQVVTQNFQEAAYWLTKCSQNTNTTFETINGKPINEQEQATRLLNCPEFYPYRAKAMAAQMLEKQSKEVSDPEAGKYGGPPTLTVLKLSQGNSSASMQNDMSVIAGAIMQGVAQVRIKEIKRGEPLESLISLQIPKGTKVFPIRVLLTSAQGAEQQQDFYFYKDSFGDWAQVPKQ